MKTIITAVLFVCLTYGIKAQEALTGPHGGRMKIAQGFRVEVVGCENYIEIYIFNEALEPLFNNGITGDVTFFHEGKTSDLLL